MRLSSFLLSLIAKYLELVAHKFGRQTEDREDEWIEQISRRSAKGRCPRTDEHVWLSSVPNRRQDLRKEN